MKRTNQFILAPTRNQEAELARRALACAKLWNEVTYERRQAYFMFQRFSWQPEIYKKYVLAIGSATAQQIVNKNNEAWRSFFALKELERKAQLPPTIMVVRPPRYWKRNGRYRLTVLCRNDSYKIQDDALKLPSGLRVRFKGELRWFGKQGRLEVHYDRVSRKWRVFQPVRVHSSASLKPRGSKTCHVDLGVRNLATVWMPRWSRPIAYNGGSMLADWWYWTKRIASHESRLKLINGRDSSRQLSRLYRIRKHRFRHAVNTFARQLVSDLCELGVSRIVVGDLRGIRDKNTDHSRQVNGLIHNFWSHKYVVDRIRWTVQEYGIYVKAVSEAYTSQKRPRCGFNSKPRKRLFQCGSCRFEAHRDAVGVVNMASLSRKRMSVKGNAVRVVAHPMLLRWDGCGWNRKNGMPTQQRNTVEA